MSTVEIVSSSTCPFAQRTRMALLEKNISFDLVEIDLDNKPRWFLKISPYGKVPILRHNDKVIFESSVINEYLEDVFPQKHLLPDDPAAKAQARIWIDFANVRFIPHVYKLMLAQDLVRQKIHKKKLIDALLMIEHEGLGKLSDGPYWLGEKVSLVDLSFLPHLQRLCVLKHYRDFEIPEECILLKSWLQLMHQRPSVQSMLTSEKTLIDNWAKYAFNTSTGTTASDMREV